MVGLRRCHLYGHTQRSTLSVTVQVAGPGGGRGGVGVGHRIPQLGRVAFEECPTGMTELGAVLNPDLNVSKVKVLHTTVHKNESPVLTTRSYCIFVFVAWLDICAHYLTTTCGEFH